jgi:hypothetical protein
MLGHPHDEKVRKTESKGQQLGIRATCGQSDLKVVEFKERAKAEGVPRLSQEEESTSLSFSTISICGKSVKALADFRLHLSRRATVLNLSELRGGFE